MHPYRPKVLLILFSALCLLLLNACTSMGSSTLPRDRFNYNEALAESRNQQMLLNVVRLRYLDIPDFIAVSSVITSYTYEGEIGVERQRTDSNTDLVPETFTGRANLAYAERPTITYSPLAGEDFSRRMLKPIPVEVIFSLGQAGWPLDILLTIALQRMNEVENMGFGQVPTPGDVDRDEQFAQEARNLQQFQRVLELLLVLSRAGAIEVQYRQHDGSKLPHLTFAKRATPPVAVLIDELKRILNLDPKHSTFQVTERMTGRDADEITINRNAIGHA